MARIPNYKNSQGHRRHRLCLIDWNNLRAVSGIYATWSIFRVDIALFSDGGNAQ